MNKVYNYLVSKGHNPVEVNRPSGRFYKIPCPVCGEKDFVVNVDTGSYNCFHLKKCGIKGSFRDLKHLYGDYDIMRATMLTYADLSNVTVDKPDGTVGEFLKSRGFVPEVYRKFKDVLGRKENAICFLYKYKGKLYSIKYRDMKEKKFWKEKNTAPLLYNMDMCEGLEDIIIVEGELDVIAAKHYGINAVSIPNGAQDASWLEYNWDYIQKYKRVIFCYDNDEAGQANIYSLAKRIGLAKCINVMLPYKDMNECLLQGVPQEDIYKCFMQGEEFGNKYVKSCDNYVDKVITVVRDKNKSKGIPTAFNELNSILGGWRAGEVTVWTGINHAGKTTVLLQQALDLCHKHERVLIGSFEMQPERYLKWLVQMEKGETEDEYEIREVLYKLSDYLFCIDRVGSIKAKELYDTIEYATRRYDVKHVIIDSLMRIQYKTQDTYKEQSEMMVELCRLAQEFDIHIHLVAHPRKGDSDVEEPDKVDIAGTADITNNAHNVIVVYRVDTESKKDLKKLKVEGICNTILIVKKNREMGKLGRCSLVFDETKKIFSDAY